MKMNFTDRIFLNRNLMKHSPTYIVGVDATLTYHILALCKFDKGHAEILITKTFDNKKKFDKMVKNLSKYFNAEVVKEKL